MLKLLNLLALLASFSIDASSFAGAGIAAPNSPSSPTKINGKFLGIKDFDAYQAFKKSNAMEFNAALLNSGSTTNNGTLAFRVIFSVNKNNVNEKLSFFKELLNDGANVIVGNNKGSINDILESNKVFYADFIKAVEAQKIAVQRQEMIDGARLSVDPLVASQDSVNATNQPAASNSTKNSASLSSDSDVEVQRLKLEIVLAKKLIAVDSASWDETLASLQAGIASLRDETLAASKAAEAATLAPAQSLANAIDKSASSNSTKNLSDDATANPQVSAAPVAPVIPAPDISLSSNVDQKSADDGKKTDAATQTPAKPQPTPAVNEDDTLKKTTPSFFSKKNLLIGGTIAVIASYILYANNAKAKKNSAPAAA